MAWKLALALGVHVGECVKDELNNKRLKNLLTCAAIDEVIDLLIKFCSWFKKLGCVKVLQEW